MSANPNMKIIAIDDFSTMRRIIKNLLKQAGYENVFEAEDGQKALEIIRAEKVDLIISDWNMPKLNGFDLLKIVRSDPDLRQIPFVMITAESEKEKIIKAVHAGVTDYIVKPFTAKTLQEKITKIFEG